MAVETFPATGKLLATGYAENPQSAVQRTEMEESMAKQAKIRSSVSVQRPLEYLFTKTDFLAFKTWFKANIGRGADEFNWTDPVDGATKNGRIVNGEYSARPVNRLQLNWIVTFTLETQE